MPVYGPTVSLGAPPQRVITRGPNAGQSVPLFEVDFPGWQDIIHLVPTAAMSAAEVLARQAAQLQSLRNSPVPDIARHFAELGTQIDNIQDGLVSLSVAGRIATKLVGRSIPGVGTLANLADLLNAWNIFYPPIPGTHSWPDILTPTGFKNALGRWTMSKRDKEAAREVAKLDTGTYAQRLEHTLETGKIGFGWGEALQILQTSDQLTGMGLSLGPLFGAATDTFFGMLRGARFDLSGPLQFVAEAAAPLEGILIDPLLGKGNDFPQLYQQASQLKFTVDWPGALPLVDQLFNLAPGTSEKTVADWVAPLAGPVDKAVARTLYGISAVEEKALGAAVKVWNAGKYLVGLRGALTWETHIELLAAQFLALQKLRPYLAAGSWGERLAPLTLQSAGGAEVPFVPQSRDMNNGDLSAALRDGPARYALEWIEEAPGHDAALFTRSLISSYSDLLLEVLEPSRPKVISRPGLADRVWYVLAELDLGPPFHRSDAELERYLISVQKSVVDWDPKLPPRALLERIWVDSFPGAVLE